MADQKKKAIADLKKAYRNKNLALYPGAGVSIDNNLPSWEKLVLAMYFNKINAQQLGGWRPFSNYLFAIAEWYLANSSEPLEITARKLQKFYAGDKYGPEIFRDDLYETLYSQFYEISDFHINDISGGFLRQHNATLDAVVRICDSKTHGVRSIITYNYDSLLEIALGTEKFQPVYSAYAIDPVKVPIYHVHGYVPLDQGEEGSKGAEIVFTEDQYHRVARNPYHWSTLVQLQSMTGSIGLMVGLSLSDRNMRRLLDAVRNAPLNSRSYALLKTPDTTPPDDKTVDNIHKKAIEYLHKFQESGLKSEQQRFEGILFSTPRVKSSQPMIKSSRAGEKGPRYRFEIAGIIEQVKMLDKEQQEFVLDQLGIKPLWFDDYSEIPGILGEITGR